MKIKTVKICIGCRDGQPENALWGWISKCPECGCTTYGWDNDGAIEVEAREM